MKEVSIRLNLGDEAASQELGTVLASHLQAPLVLGFKGDLGAGKTTVIRALLKALGVNSTIKSPTFTLVESYQCPDFKLHHFDLYRLEDEVELEYLGFRDYFQDDCVCCIEWPERAQGSLAGIDVMVELDRADVGRIATLKALSQQGLALLKDI